jgi:hypothetical protein
MDDERSTRTRRDETGQQARRHLTKDATAPGRRGLTTKRGRERDRVWRHDLLRTWASTEQNRQGVEPVAFRAARERAPAKRRSEHDCDSSRVDGVDTVFEPLRPAAVDGDTVGIRVWVKEAEQ